MGLHRRPDSRGQLNCVLAPFPTIPYRPGMPDTPNLRPATRDELTQSLSFALRFNGRKRVPAADEVMARITAERLAEHLERSGSADRQARAALKKRFAAAAGGSRRAATTGGSDVH